VKLDNLRDFKADLWVFDNDGTLYNNPSELEKVVVAKMIKYIALRYNLSYSKAKEKRKELLQRHCTKYTLIAIKQEGISENDFIQKTYLSINPSDFGIKKSPELRELINSLLGEKIVLTNNPSEFADLILEHLGIKDLFSQIIGMREMNYIQKPDKRSFGFLEKSINNGKKVMFIDNEFANIETAKEVGCFTFFAKGGLLCKN
jgi:putative hydrolase of the HAD superfamily